MAGQPIVADAPVPDPSGLPMLQEGYSPQTTASAQHSQDLAQALAAMRDEANDMRMPVDPAVDLLTHALMQRRYGRSTQDFAQAPYGAAYASPDYQGLLADGPRKLAAPNQGAPWLDNHSNGENYQPSPNDSYFDPTLAPVYLPDASMAPPLGQSAAAPGSTYDQGIQFAGIPVPDPPPGRHLAGANQDGEYAYADDGATSRNRTDGITPVPKPVVTAQRISSAQSDDAGADFGRPNLVNSPHFIRTDRRPPVRSAQQSPFGQRPEPPDAIAAAPDPDEVSRALHDGTGNIVGNVFGDPIQKPDNASLEKVAALGHWARTQPLAVQILVWSNFRQNGSLDFQRVNGVFNPDYRDFATVAIGVMGASMGWSPEDTLLIESLYGVAKSKWPGQQMSKQWPALPKQNVYNTYMGYRLYNTEAYKGQ